MPSNTKYTVRNGETEVATKSKKSAAIDLANEQADANRGETFTVVTSAGTEVHSVTRKPAGSHASPWTRVSEREIEALTIPAGFTASYPRMRIPALVCRANDKSGWLVVTPEGNHEAKDTVEAREITNRLGKAAAEARAKAKADAKAQKAADREKAKAEKVDAA
jgi:hypothetical protein